MQALKGMGGGVTASYLPGTTLGITELDLGNGMSLFDTPGLIVPSQVRIPTLLPPQNLNFPSYHRVLSSSRPPRGRVLVPQMLVNSWCRQLLRHCRCCCGRFRVSGTLTRLRLFSCVCGGGGSFGGGGGGGGGVCVCVIVGGWGVTGQLTNRLEMEELAAVLPQKRVEHVTYRVNPGSCVHLGGLASIELGEFPAP